MSDQKTGLPVRSESDGLDERVHVKIVDGTNPSVNQVTVDSDKNLHVEGHGNNPAGTDVEVRLSELGSTSVDGIYDGSDNSDPSQVGVVGMVRDDTPADSQQTIRITSISNGDGDVRSLDISLHDEDGEPYSATNPVPVSFEESEGTEIHDYKSDAAIAKDASVNHDYAVTVLKTFLLRQVLCSGSGRAKFEIQIETGVGDDTYDTVAVRFNSTAFPDSDLVLKVPIIVAAGINVRVIKTNRDNQAQDLYTTIIGVER